MSGTFHAPDGLHQSLQEEVNGLNGGTAQVHLCPFLPHYGGNNTSLPLSSFCDPQVSLRVPSRLFWNSV